MFNSNPELSKIKEICTLFNCTADELLFGNVNIQKSAYSEIKVEVIESFEYVKYTVISKEPEDDALYRIRQIAKTLGITNPKIIGWDFSHLSFDLISNAYKAVFQYIKVNRYTYHHFAFEHQFCIDGTEYMKICVAIQ